MKHADNEPELFRARAEELRMQAEEAHSLDGRHVHLGLAELCERMAPRDLSVAIKVVVDDPARPSW